MKLLEVNGGHLACWDSLPQARVFTIANAGHHIAADARDELLAILRESARGA